MYLSDIVNRNGRNLKINIKNGIIYFVNHFKTFSLIKEEEKHENPENIILDRSSECHLPYSWYNLC